MRRLNLVLLLLPIVLVGPLAGCAGSPPTEFMTNPDQLTPCASAPHCVSSQADADSARHVAPLTYSASADGARQALLKAIYASDNATVEDADDRFIHATFKSTLGFVDDMTGLVQPQAGIIDIKSSSRIGYYDFGVNRRRVETLRARFNALLDNG